MIRMVFLLAVSAVFFTTYSEAKGGYNVWSKEKIRYLNSRIISDPYNPQLHLLLANALIEDDLKHEAKQSLKMALDLDSTFAEAYCNLGVYICYDRHFPEGWRALALNGAEYIVNPSATVAGLSQYLWELEQPASAVANGCFIGAINRVGSEEPWNIGKFYGSSYVVNPRGKIEAQLGEEEDGLLVHDMDMDMVREIRNLWQFFRDRRPEVYEDLIELR